VVTLATLFESKAGKTDKTRRLPSTKDPELAAHILHKRISRLGKQIRSAARSETISQWSGYQQSASHYQPADTEAKQQFVENALERLRPEQVLDIGANTGIYSRMAAKAGAQVVALDSDSAAIEALWQTAEQRGLAVTALVANIARPTPAVGWINREQLSLLNRLSGQFDLVLMLAVIHHLLLREQVPLGHIADLCSSLTRRWLLLEWVPPSDSMFQEWLRGRDELYGHLTEADLTRAFAPFFAVSDRTVLGNGRVLLLFDRTSLAGSQGEAATA
jgi:2-polyprenyl-3-methyl-5-hydroxy-6-metoxy-1,4-benzoquinol methylase